MKLLHFFVCTIVCLAQANHPKRLSKAEFRACVKKCGDQYEDCSRLISHLWRKFSENKDQIMKSMIRCCLQGEVDHKAAATLSFATCVRENCRAEMWG
ncbi:uncharacterized protein DEA37_0004269 [Paragonimus westermani]|uniref:Saposin B-type domain-containing protein n=1 Tax=Paragonimus westermani TaxID=34504 RepID=A0A5J4NDQ9_9TREM|nr:uncharacterized protein DEA37_0004269 [Paragonimus westermani]